MDRPTAILISPGHGFEPFSGLGESGTHADHKSELAPCLTDGHDSPHDGAELR